MQTKNDPGVKPSDSLPPWPSEPPATAGPAGRDGSEAGDAGDAGGASDPRSGLIKVPEQMAEPAGAGLVERVATLEQERADLARAEKALRESSLVQIRRLAALEREAETTKSALAAAVAEREALRARNEALEDESLALREAVAAAEAGMRDASAALADVTRALEVAAAVAKR